MKDQDPKNNNSSTDLPQKDMKNQQNYNIEDDDEVDDAEKARLRKINEKIEHLFEEGGELHGIEKIQAAQKELEAKQKKAAEKKTKTAMGNFSDTTTGKMPKMRKKTGSSGQEIHSNKLRDLEESTFLGQHVTLSDYIFLPEGLEFPLMLIYFLLIPYGMGIFILFLFVADQDISKFLVFDIFTVIPVWSIGYEAVAAVIMLSIIKSAVTFSYKKRKAIKKLENDLRKKMRRMENSRSKFG